MNLTEHFDKIMKKKINRIYTTIIMAAFMLMLVTGGNAYSQSIGRVGTTAAPFLKIGVGGRALGMGEAYATQAEDVSGVYWNPAGTARLEQMQVSFSHYSYLADLYYDFGAIALPVQEVGTFGFFIGHLGMPDIERTTIQFPNGTGEMVSAGSYVFGLNYSRALTDRFSFGGNVKYIRENIWNSSASSFAFDAGVLYKTFFKNIRIGMSISNFGSDMQMSGRDMLVQHDISQNVDGNNPNINSHLDTDQFPLPIIFRVGVSSNLAKDFFGMEQHDWIISFDAVHPNDNKEYVNAGTELKLFNTLALRAGYRQLFLEEREGGLSFGVGLQYKVMDVNINLDYANVDYGRLDHHNKFSLTLAF